MDAAGNFVYRTLKVPKAELPETCVEVVRRVESAKRTLAHDEELIAFTNAGARDLVARHTPDLAGERNSNGNPTARIRMEVPDFLGGTFKLLERHGHAP